MLMAVGFRRIQPDGNGFYRLNPAIRPPPAVCGYLRLSARRNLDYALAAGTVFLGGLLAPQHLHTLDFLGCEPKHVRFGRLLAVNENHVVIRYLRRIVQRDAGP